MILPEVDKMWDDFVERFPYTDKTFDTVVFLCKVGNIDPALFINNLFYLTGKIIFPEQEIKEPTASITQLLQYLPPSYSLFFVAAYPDAVLWFMNNYDPEKSADNVYFKDLLENSEKHFDENNNITRRFMMTVRVAYLKSNDFTKFECSL